MCFVRNFFPFTFQAFSILAKSAAKSGVFYPSQLNQETTKNADIKRFSKTRLVGP